MSALYSDKIKSYQELIYQPNQTSLSTTGQIEIEISHSQTNWADLANAYLLTRVRIKKGVGATDDLDAADQCIIANAAELIQSIELLGNGQRLSYSNNIGILKTMLEPVFRGSMNRKARAYEEKNYFLDVPYDTRSVLYRDTTDNTSETYNGGFSSAQFGGTAWVNATSNKTYATKQSLELYDKALEHDAGYFQFRLPLHQVLGIATVKQPLTNMRLTLRIMPKSTGWENAFVAGATLVTGFALDAVRLVVPRIEYDRDVETELVKTLMSQPMQLNFHEFDCNRRDRSGTREHQIVLAQKSVADIPRYLLVGLNIRDTGANKTQYNNNLHFANNSDLSLKVEEIYITVSGHQIDTVRIEPWNDKSTSPQFYRAYDHCMALAGGNDKSLDYPIDYTTWRDRAAIFVFDLTQNQIAADKLASVDVVLNYTLSAATGHNLDYVMINERMYSIDVLGGSSVTINKLI